MKKLFAGIIGISLFLTPVFVFGAVETAPGGFPNTGPGAGISNPPSSGSFSTFQITNPLKVQSVCGLIKSVLQALLIIGLPIAVLFLVFAGLKYVAALGKPEKISEANSNLLWTVIGIAIFIGAALIAQVIVTTVGQISAQSGAGFQSVNTCI